MNNSRNLLIGLLLLAVGIVSLLENLDLFNLAGEYLFGIFFVAAGVIFLQRYYEQTYTRDLIFAAAAGYVGLVLLLETIRGIDDNWSGVLLFVILALASAYAHKRQDSKRWGLLVFSGISLTLAAVVTLAMWWWIPGEMIGATLFLGLGLTFGYLYLRRDEDNSLERAKAPALGLIAFSGFLFFVGLGHSVSRFVLPVVLVAIGVALVANSLRHEAEARKLRQT